MLLYGSCCVVVHPIVLLYQSALNKMTMQLGQDKLKIVLEQAIGKLISFGSNPVLPSLHGKPSLVSTRNGRLSLRLIL